MDKERLLRIADIVDETPDERWNMRTWLFEAACGTVGCAVGNAIAAGVLPEIKVHPVYGLQRAEDERPRIINESALLARVLDISVGDVSYLFDPDKYANECWEPGDHPRLVVRRKRLPQGSVSKRIRQFVYEAAGD